MANSHYCVHCLHHYTLLYSPILFTTGLIVPILKKSTLNPNFAQNYRQITLSCIHTKMVEALILPDTDLFYTQFGFRENRGTAFACNLLNDITSYFKLQNSPVFVAALDAEFFWIIYVTCHCF